MDETNEIGHNATGTRHVIESRSPVGIPALHYSLFVPVPASCAQAVVRFSCPPFAPSVETVMHGSKSDHDLPCR